MGHAWQTDFTLLISHFLSICLPLLEHTPSLNYWPLQGYCHDNLINDRTNRYIEIIHQYEDKSSVNTQSKCALSMSVSTQCLNACASYGDLQCGHCMLSMLHVFLHVYKIKP